MRLVLLLVLATLAIALSASAQSVNWIQYINQTDGSYNAYGVCTFGEYLAVVGYKYNGGCFVALLDKATGEVVKTWRENIGMFYNCLSIGDRLYVVGNCGMYVFDKGLNVVKSSGIYFPTAISFDGSYLYLAGNRWRDVDGDGVKDPIWRIEKRTLELDLVAYKEYYREWDKAYEHEPDVYDIAVNPATGDLWLVGKLSLFNRTARRYVLEYSLLVIFDKGLDVKRVVEYPLRLEGYLRWLNGICFDGGGNAYVVDWKGVAKFDKNGNVLAMNEEVRGLKIACVGGRVYVFGEKPVGNYGRHVLYVLDEDLNPMGELILSKNVEGDSFFWRGRPAFDGRNLYVAGFDYKRSIIYSISLSLPTVRVVVQAVDGFGQPRDWPVEIEGVASGMGRVEAEVVEGQRYVARATGLGFTNATEFVAMGPQMVVGVKIPTARLKAGAVNGFGELGDWNIEIAGVVSGRGFVEADVLAGNYTVRVMAFGREFTQSVAVQAGQLQTTVLRVPTARLGVVVVDESGKLIEDSMTIQIIGPVTQRFQRSFINYEVLAGNYTIRVSVFGRGEVSKTVELRPGDEKTVEVTVPSPPYHLFIPAVAVLAASLALVGLRSRNRMQSEPPPEELCLEHQGGFIRLGGYTIVGRSNFDWLPDEVRGKIEEKHLAVYYRKGEWWVKDLGSRHGTYVNGVRVKKARIGEGDVISPSAVVVLKVGKCGSVRMVRPMTEEDTTETFGGSAQGH